MSAAPFVLLVEDNPITRKLVRLAFEKENIELVDANDGATAIAIATDRRPDLILQDLLLPDMDGFELVQRLRQLPLIRTVPILAFSGLLSQLDETKIGGSGFTDFVTKPIEPSKLVRIVRAHLPASEAAPVAFGRQRRIILADDDEVQRKLSVFRLTRLGFDVVDVADGQAALDAARQQRPAAILTDAMMPVLDGFGLCSAVRQDEQLKDIPIVLVTSTYVDERDRELSRLAGANQFVIRTPDLRDLIEALKSVLGGGQRHRASGMADTAEFERERASRTMVQLERQAAAAASARAQCATLSAELAVLHAISEALTQDKDIDQVLREILAACCDAGGVSVGALHVTMDGKAMRTIQVVSHVGDGGATPSPEMTRAELDAVMVDHRVKLVTRRDATGAELDWLTRKGVESALVVPLQHKGQSLGALVMMSISAEFGLDERMVFAEAVAYQVSVALTLTRAFEERETAARLAREHARLLESVFSSISDPIVVVDASGRATTWNQAASDLIGAKVLARQHAPYPDWTRHFEMFHTDRATPFAAAERPIARALRGEHVERVDAFLTYPQNPDGAWISVAARPLLDESGAVRGAVAVTRDVTAEKSAQEQLLISDRMASIGMMAAGVGHEINNPLSAVVANLEMASSELTSLGAELGPEALGDLPAAIREAYQAAQLVRRIAADLKVFSSGQADDNAPVDVEAVLESALRMAWNEIRHRARITKQFAGVPPALGAESRLGQVFLNLLVNAAHAIPVGHVDGNEIRLATSVDDRGRIVVEIADTGGGIAPQVMKRLFTPFVTTKPLGVGTGLGLSICQRLVTAMGGEIWAESTVGVGTVFRVALPPVHADAVSEAPGAAAAGATEHEPSGRADILVIDDEDLIGMLLTRALKAHNVTVMSSAKDAMARIEAGERFDLILCDLMMPVMTGIEFHAALTRRFPEQARALMFLTGGAFSKETAAFLDSVPNRHLEKPFDVGKLRQCVNDHLKRAARRQDPRK